MMAASHGPTPCTSITVGRRRRHGLDGALWLAGVLCVFDSTRRSARSQGQKVHRPELQCKTGIVIVDCAVYENGARAAEPLDLENALTTARARGGFVWIGLHEPTAEEFVTVAQAFDLHPLAVEDAIHAHQRPKLERYGDSLFMVLKPARYVDAEEVVDVGQIMVFLGADFVVTVRHGQPTALADVRRMLEEDPDRLEWGPGSVLYAIADKVVDDYATVIVGLDNDIDQIEQSVFAGPKPTHAERIFKLKREVLDFRRAVDPL